MPFQEFAGNQPTDWHELGKWWDAGTEKIKPEVLLRQVAPSTFQLVRGFSYALPSGHQLPVSTVELARWNVKDRRDPEVRPEAKSSGHWPVPPHNLRANPEDAENSTDLASVPSWLWWYIASYGRHSRAALLHDHLIGAKEPLVTDRQADHVFRMALAEADVPIMRRWLMWDAVSLASLWRTASGKAGVIGFALHLLTFLGVLAYAVVSSWGGLGPVLAEPFQQAWRLLDALSLPGAASELTEGLWAATDATLPSTLEGQWWKVAILGLAGLLGWRKRWVITLAGLVIVFVPALAVFAARALAQAMEVGVWLVAKAVRIEAPAAPVRAGRSREQIGRM